MVGRIAATTPTGTPISTILSSGISRRMPTVFMPRMRRGSQSRAEQILDVLVFGVAVAGLFDREIGQALGVGARRRGHALHNGVHLLLGVGAVLLPGSVRLLDLGADLLNGQEVFILEHRPATS